MGRTWMDNDLLKSLDEERMLLKEENGGLRVANEALRAKIKDLEAENAEYREVMDSLCADNDGLYDEIASLREEIGNLEDAVMRAKSQNQDLEKEANAFRDRSLDSQINGVQLSAHERRIANLESDLAEIRREAGLATQMYTTPPIL